MESPKDSGELVRSIHGPRPSLFQRKSGFTMATRMRTRPEAWDLETLQATDGRVNVAPAARRLNVASAMATQGFAGPKTKAVAVHHPTAAGDVELLFWGWANVPGSEYGKAGAAQTIGAMIDLRTQALLEAFRRPL